MTDSKDFMVKAQKQMDDWAAEMNKMQSQMLKANKDAQDQMLKQMEALNSQRKAFEAQIEEMAKTNLATARDVQSKAEKAWADMEKQMADARKKMMG